MKRLPDMVFVALFVAFILTACVVAPGPPGYGVGVEIAPPLPAVIELGEDPYYYQSGYYYFYNHDRWQYSRARGGPWRELPRSHWPREVRGRGR
jgi:hypothetical protein